MEWLFDLHALRGQLFHFPLLLSVNQTFCLCSEGTARARQTDKSFVIYFWKFNFLNGSFFWGNRPPPEGLKGKINNEFMPRACVCVRALGYVRARAIELTAFCFVQIAFNRMKSAFFLSVALARVRYVSRYVLFEQQDRRVEAERGIRGSY